MKLIINTSMNLVGGGLQVALSFLNECIAFKQNEYHVFLNNSVKEQLEERIFPANFFFYTFPSLNFIQIASYCSKLELRIKPDIVFTIFGPSYWKPRSLHVQGFARGYYIYPESPFWRKCTIGEKININIHKIFHLFFFKRDSCAYICESEDATNRISKIFGTNKLYYTVSNTCSSVYHDYCSTNDLKKLPNKRDNEFRFICLTRYYKHKNIDLIKPILDELFKRGIDNISFVVTLTNDEYFRLFQGEYNNNIYNVGHININDCPALYKECDAAFIPTSIECFSASYPEAMAMGLPILTSDLDFAHAICKDACLYFKVNDVMNIVNLIEKLLQDKKMQDELIFLGYNRLRDFPSAKHRAELFLQICSDIINKYNLT